jgi:RNA polymerase sigma factor (sigma-70 family)
MVLAACRRVLGTGPDADDAFQAAFLVLARKAAKLRDGRTIGCWLFGVARHAALKLRDKERRRKWHESKAMRRTTMENNESRTIEAVDEELHRLAERYRSPLVACLLEGQTQEEAAREAGCSLSTLRRNLDKGRELLRSRLTRRGIVSAVALMGLGGASVPLAVAGDVARLAVGFVTGESAARSAAIAQGVLVMMTREKLKAAAALLLLMAGIAGTGIAWQFASAQQLPLPAQSATKEKQANPPTAANPAAPAKVEDKIKPGDVLYMSAINDFETAPLTGVYAVEAAGTLAIGPTYGGRVKVEGLTLEEAEKALQAHVRNYARKAEVMLRRADPLGLEARVRLLELEVKELKEVIAELRKKK